MADAQQNTEQKKERWFRLNYTWIVRHLSFIAFIVLLLVLYIANGHWADKQIRNINKAAVELKELRYEYLTIKSELMFKGKLSEIVQITSKSIGLKEITEPPMVLGDTTKPIQ